MPVMSHARKQFSMVASEDYIFALGGLNHGGPIRDCEKFDPKDAVPEWEHIREMNRR